jgi:hypothetical protein
LLLLPINYDKISAFEVKQFNEFSDHSPIFFELLKIASALRLVLLNRFLAEMYE